MSFYEVIRTKFPGKKEAQIADIIGCPLMTFRGWRHQEPRASTIASVAEKLDMAPATLFREFVADLKKQDRGDAA